MGLLSKLCGRERKTLPTAGAQRALSLLAPDKVAALGRLPGAGICGFLVEVEGREEFRPNRIFVELMHRVIAETGFSEPSLIAAAKAQQSGYLYIIDFRTPEGPTGNVPPADIVGCFEVEDGALVPGGYQPNSRYRIFTEDGLPRLPAPFHAALIAAIEARA